jgi:hypothetical protein
MNRRLQGSGIKRIEERKYFSEGVGGGVPQATPSRPPERDGVEKGLLRSGFPTGDSGNRKNFSNGFQFPLSWCVENWKAQSCALF